MNYLNKGLAVIAGSFAFNVLETWYFGWNLHAQSTAEGFADMASATGILIGSAFIFGHVIGSIVNIKIELRVFLKQLVAVLKISWYYRQSLKALNECIKALEREDFDEAERLERVHLEYEKKADACDWRKETTE